METIKINLKSPIGGLKELSVKEMIETSDELQITLNDNSCYMINPNQSIMFKRYIYDDSGGSITLTSFVNVINEDENHVIHTTKPANEKIMLDKSEDSIRYISGFTETDGEFVFYDYYIIRTASEHHLYGQDLSLDVGQELSFYDYEGNLLGVYSGLSIPLKREDRAIIRDDCLTLVEDDDTCGKSYKKVKTYRYDFLPEKVSQNMIIVRDFDADIVSDMAYCIPKFNPFYYTYIITDGDGNPSELNEYNEPIIHCRLYGDAWWSSIKSLESNEVNYINSGNTHAAVAIDTAYWGVDVSLGNSVNEGQLVSEDQFSTTYVSDIEETLIPDIIDMERVKYSLAVYDSGVTAGKNAERYYKWVSPNSEDYPVIYIKEWLTPETTEVGQLVSAYTRVIRNHREAMHLVTETPLHFIADYNSVYRNGVQYYLEGDKSDIGTFYPTDELISDEYEVATSMTLYFHFRKRLEISDTIRETTANTNSNLTSGNVYYDGWYIDPDNDSTTWWNTMNYNGSGFNASVFDTFIEDNGKTSDLLGYLNFNDNDVYYQKKKVSQTFVRLLFYTSNDPLEQKLLYYSTIFFDEGSLYGKFVKQLMFMEENSLVTEDDNMNAVVVFCSANTVSGRVDSQILVTNEFDRERSAEGFNVYLFNEDKNLNLENGEKTIYMKIEFNHAGNGKTIPMILWPKDEDGDYCPLTVSNFVDSLYIPVKLIYLDGKYMYYIPNAVNNKDGNIELVLFEPKLDYLDGTEEIQ